MNKQAYTLIELLIATVLAFTLSLLALSLLNYSTKLMRTLTKQYSKDYQALRLETLSLKIRKEIDQHPLRILPIIHKNGEILFSDGSMNKTIPKESNALSYLNFKFQDLLTIEHIKDKLFKACPRYQSKPLTKHTNYVGIGLAETVYLKASIIEQGFNNCLILELIPAKNMFFPEHM